MSKKRSNKNYWQNWDGYGKVANNDMWEKLPDDGYESTSDRWVNLMEIPYEQHQMVQTEHNKISINI